MPVRPTNLRIVEDPTAIDTRALARKLEAASWRDLLESGDLRIEPLFLTAEAWLYFLPAFLLMVRTEENLVGYDMGILRMPPSNEPEIEPVSIEKLEKAVTAEHLRAIRSVVELHYNRSDKQSVFEPGYVDQIWDNYWKTA